MQALMIGGPLDGQMKELREGITTYQVQEATEDALCQHLEHWHETPDECMDRIAQEIEAGTYTEPYITHQYLPQLHIVGCPLAFYRHESLDGIQAAQQLAQGYIESRKKTDR